MKTIVAILLFVIVFLSCNQQEKTDDVKVKQVKVYDTIAVAEFIEINNLMRNFFILVLPIR